MLVARGTIENRQAILRLGLQPLVPAAPPVGPSAAPVQIPIREYRALIDTGAQRTCLTKATVAKERLIAHGKRPIQNVHSANVHRLFYVNLGFWCDDPAPLGAQESHKSYFALPEPTEAIDIASNNWFDAIVGMDVLSRYDLTIERTGHFQLRLT
jgi:hypothetical protein